MAPDEKGRPFSGRPLPLAHLGRTAKTEDLCGSPLLRLWVGRDRISSGATIDLVTPSGGVWPHSELVLTERWNAPIPDVESAVVVAIQALESYLGKIRGIQTDNSV